MSELSCERLRELLHYNPETGVFTWRSSKGRARANDQAGTENRSKSYHPHRIIMIDGRRYLSGRLAWLYMTGEWPKHEIDHRDRDSLNDTWSNLREATSSENNINQKLRCDNTTGYKGVYLDRSGKFFARVYANGVHTHLGMFVTAEEAHGRYRQVMLAMHGDFVP